MLLLENFLTAIKAKAKVIGSPEEKKALTRLKEMEKIIGYKFKEKLLLQQAFTHPSYQGSESYERLEYVGDSILNFLISKQQFFMYPNLPPGSLTALRAANVDTEKLARVAVKYNFHNYLRHENPLLSKQVCYFKLFFLELCCDGHLSTRLFSLRPHKNKFIGHSSNVYLFFNQLPPNVFLEVIYDNMPLTLIR